MRHSSILIKCATCKNLKGMWYLLLLSALFWGAGTAVASTWTPPSTLAITDHVTGNLSAEIYNTLNDAGASYSNVKQLSIAPAATDTLNAADITALQNLKANLEELTLTNLTSYRVIPNGAFRGFGKLSSVRLGNGIIKIGDNAFTGCTSLPSIALSGVTSLGTGAFKGCTALTSISSVSSLRAIGDSVFYNCISFAPSINSLQNVRTIGNYAFYGCTATSFAFVTLTNLTSLGKSAFENCTHLSEVIFPENKPEPLGQNAFSFNAFDFTNATDVAWVDELINGSENNVFLNQRPRVNFSLSEESKTVPLNCDFHTIKPNVSLRTNSGTLYSNITTTKPYWVATDLSEPTVNIYYSGTLRNDEQWLQANLLKTANPGYVLQYKLVLSDNIPYDKEQVIYNLTVSEFVTDDGRPNEKTTTELTLNFPDAVETLRASDITLSGTGEPSGSAIVSTPVKVGDGHKWRVPLTNVSVGSVEVQISAGAYPGGAKQTILLDKGPMLKFDPQGGTVDPTEKAVETNAQIGDLPEPRLKGYHSKGWFAEPNGAGMVYSPTTQYQQTIDVTVYAYWEANNNYKIVFNPNGGVVIPGSKVGITYDAAIGTLPGSTTTTRSGYEFIEWNTLLDGTGDMYDATTIYKIDGDTTLFAQWDANTYAIKFKVNDGTDTYLNNGNGKPVTYDLRVGDLPVPPVRNGYTFQGWNTLPNGMGATYTAETPYTIAGDTTFFAQWKGEDYTLHFNKNDGTEDPYLDSKTVTYGSAIGALPLPNLLPVRANYTFTNEWNTKQDGTGVMYTAATIYSVRTDVTLYAQWIGDVHTLNFNKNDGTTNHPGSKAVRYGSKVGELPAPTRVGYVIAGWNTSADGNGDPYTETTIYYIDRDTTLYAQWTGNTYKINFDRNDDSGTLIDSQDVIYGSKIGTLPEQPTRDTYLFIGWNTSADGSGDPYTETTIYNIVGDTTLYAQWTGKTYVLNFDANDGTGTLIGNKDVIFSLAVGALPEPTRENYHFSGWKTAGGVPYTETTVYEVAGNTTLYAQWIGDAYILKFNKNDGTSNNLPDQTVHYGSAVGTLPAPARVGYVITGWNTKEDGTGDPYNASTVYYIVGDTTLYAQWTGNTYTLKFNKNDGTTNHPDNKSVTYNSPIGTLPVPVRDGYTFDGWNTLQDGTGDFHTAEIPYQWAVDTIFYAQWTILSDNTTISDIVVDNSTQTEYNDGGGNGEDNIPALCYLMNCGEDIATVTVTTEDPDTKIIYKGEEISGSHFEITLEKYGVIPVTFTVKAPAGNTKDTTFYIARRFPFEQVVVTRWDNTMTIINNPVNNGGFHFNSYEWYANDRAHSTQRSISAGPDGRSLNLNTAYYIVLTADEYEGKLPTCIGYPKMRQDAMKIYPNPVQVNTALSVEISDTLQDADIEVYSATGTLLKRERVAGGVVNTINLNYPAGTYLVRVNGQTTVVIVE